MRKLFLCSSYKDVAGLFPEFAGCDLSEKMVTFIPTAALHEKVNFYVKSGRKALERVGLVIDELEVSSADRSLIMRKLKANDFIYVSGGNTFFLLQELKRTGTDQAILEQIGAGKIYIGESAGAMIVAPDIEYAKDMDDCAAAPGLENYSALHAVAFYPLPHHTNFPFKKAVEKIIAKHAQALPLQPISNAQAILVEDDRVEIKP